MKFADDLIASWTKKSNMHPYEKKTLILSLELFSLRHTHQLELFQ